MSRVFSFLLLHTVFVPSALAAGTRGEGDGWQAGSFFGIFACVLFWHLWKNLRRLRGIEDTPTAKVASAPQGEVELSGVAGAVQSTSTVCPMTGTRCLWYFFKVERYERRGKNSRWVTISEGRSSEVFCLQDETGTSLVVPLEAEVTSRRHRQWRGSSPSPTNSPGEGGWWGGFGAYRYTEDLILPGDPVYVLGWFETLNGAPSSPAEVNEKLRALKKNPQELLTRFDSDKDGAISAEEWDAARATVEQETFQKARSAPVLPDVHTIRSPPPEAGSPFLISSLSQEELAGTYKRNAVLCLIGFLACGSVAVGLLFHSMKGL